MTLKASKPKAASTKKSAKARRRSAAGRAKQSAPRRVNSRRLEGPRLTTKLIRIGNSRGVRLPKVIIEQAGLREGKIELLVRDDEVVLRSASPRTRKRNAREGWDEQIKAALAEHGNELTDEDREWLDAPLDPETDDSEWVW